MAYYENVNKIPAFFSPDEWKASEKIIYDSMVNEINGQFSARGTFDSGGRKQLLETFGNERNKYLAAKGKQAK